MSSPTSFPSPPPIAIAERKSCFANRIWTTYKMCRVDTKRLSKIPFKPEKNRQTALTSKLLGGLPAVRFKGSRTPDAEIAVLADSAQTDRPFQRL